MSSFRLVLKFKVSLTVYSPLTIRLHQISLSILYIFTHYIDYIYLNINKTLKFYDLQCIYLKKNHY